MREVKFGLFSITGRYAQALQSAKRADNQGFYSILLNDHFFSPFRPAREPQLECFTTLSAIAAVDQDSHGFAGRGGGVSFSAAAGGDRLDAGPLTTAAWFSAWAPAGSARSMTLTIIPIPPIPSGSINSRTRSRC